MAWSEHSSRDLNGLTSECSEDAHFPSYLTLHIQDKEEHFMLELRLGSEHMLDRFQGRCQSLQLNREMPAQTFSFAKKNPKKNQIIYEMTIIVQKVDFYR